jgi:hypothetical protein
MSETKRQLEAIIEKLAERIVGDGGNGPCRCTCANNDVLCDWCGEKQEVIDDATDAVKKERK